MCNGKYYDGSKLLSLKDVNGMTPEIYICTTNRSGGKTTYFGRLVVNRFLKKREKFGVLYRYSYELDNCADKFFKDINNLFFPKLTMQSKKRSKGIYHELFLNDQPCGYAISINSADQIKKNSHLFSDISCLIFDEFQSETNHYCPNEVKKFLSIHTSIARGNFEQVRYVPVYMIANPVSILNPYYVELGITDRLKHDTKFLKGDGFVLEQGYVETASNAQKESAFNRAFKQSDYLLYSSECVYLNDNLSFIEKPTGRNRYIVTLRYEGHDYAIREYDEYGIVYCDDRVDTHFPLRVALSTNDHRINYVLLKRNDILFNNLRYLFEKGCFRFKDLRCKDVVMKALSY